VKPEVARRQKEQESQATGSASPTTGAGPLPPAASEDAVSVGSDSATAVRAPIATRYHGSVTLDPTRVGRDAGRIADEVISHLVGLVGSDVKVTLEIQATMPSGAPDGVVRIVTENSRTLKFTSHGFEQN
jgi:hypothetical protein